MSKESFLVFKSFYEPIKLLSNEDLGQLFRQIFEYQISGTEPTNTSRTFMAFQFFKNQFRLDDVKYQAVCERNKGNGAKGGRKPKPTQTNPKNPVGLKEPKQPDNEKDNDNVNVNDNKNEKDIPTSEIFLTFCKEILVDKYYPLEFSLKAKYEAWVADGWKDGNGAKIKNWKTKIKNTIPFLKPMQQPAAQSGDDKLRSDWTKNTFIK